MNIERTISAKARELVKGQSSEYRSHMEGLPALLRSAGLAQTVVFLKAKGGTQEAIYNHFETQFKGLDLLANSKTLVDLVTKASSTSEYRLYSQMALRVAYWHKRLAQAMIEKEAK